MNKRNSIIVIVALLLLALVSASASFAASRGPSTTLIGSDVEIHVAHPLAVTPVVFSEPNLEMIGESGIGVVYLGQQIIDGIIRIENRSPFDYSAHLRVEAQKVISNSWPNFEIKAWLGDNQPFHDYEVIPAGQTIEVRFEVFISSWGEPSSFAGLDLFVEAMAPPTEAIEEVVKECPVERPCG